jgi:DNA polymerase III epsilon subunit-like protein
VAYSASFDRRLLSLTHQRHGLTTPELTTACAMLLYASWNGEWVEGRQGWQWRWIKLIEAASECGVPEVGAHRARGDARMTLDVLCYLQRRTNGRKPTSWPTVR